MKSSLAKHIFKGSIISISIPLLLIFILAIKDFSLRNQLKLDSNFTINHKDLENKREAFLVELDKIRSVFIDTEQSEDRSIRKIFKQLKKSSKRGPKSLRIKSGHPFLSISEVKKLNPEEQIAYVEKISKHWQKPGNVTRRSIIQLKNYIRKKFMSPSAIDYPLLTDDNVVIQYFSYELVYQYLSLSDYILLTDTLPWVVEVIPSQKAGNNFLKNITTSQVLTQFPPKYTKIHDYLTSLKQLINFTPKPTLDRFFEFNFFSKYFEFYFKTFDPNQKKIDFFADSSVRLKNISPAKTHGLGSFAISLRTDNIYQRFLTPQKSLSYDFVDSQSSLLKKLNSLSYFKLRNSLESRVHNHYVKIDMEAISLTLQANESMQLRVKSEGQTYIINIIRDPHFSHLYHLYHDNINNIKLEKELINSASIALFGVLLLFVILFYSYVLVIPKIIRPIHRFRKAIDQTTEDLSLSHVESFYSSFIEFQIMKKTFLRKIFRIRLQFRAAEALSELQNLNAKNSTLDEFEEQCSLVYLQFFEKKYIGFDEVSNIVKLEDSNFFQNSIYDPERIILHDHSNFDAQVRFFYQRLSLQKEFLSTLQRNNELETAQVIQRDLLPSDNTKVMDIAHTPFYQPARYLGGDFYDILSDDDRTILLIADVSGKGLGSALFASSVKSYFAGQFYQKTPLEDMMAKTNNHTCLVNPNFLFCTLFAIEIHKNSDTYQFCSAGHNEMILINDQTNLLKANGLPLGLLENQTYQKKSLEFKQSDLLFLYTDGVTEAESPNDDLFGLDRLTRCLNQHRSKDTSSISSELLDLLSAHASGTEQSDDITFMVIKKSH
ncbi:MAG: serine/threonine-protein phosphatase [Candidatus Cloacimonetes bacterium]|nr:serine/threonine-protein phosphatase [Candidatus Cloacimonadota bacterium]